MQLFNKLMKTCAEHYCYSEGQTMTAKTVKIGTPNNTLEVQKKPNFRRAILKSIAVVYCEENNLEMVQKSMSTIKSIKLGTIHLDVTTYPPAAFEDLVNTCVKGYIDVHVTWEDGYVKNLYQPFDDGKLTNAEIPVAIRKVLEAQCKGKLHYAHPPQV